MTEPRELTWAKDEVIKNGGEIFPSGEPQGTGFSVYLHFRTKAGKPGTITIDLTLVLPEERVREMVRKGMAEADAHVAARNVESPSPQARRPESRSGDT